MADRNRYSRWRRLPPVFRSGEHKLPGYEEEIQRLTLYLPGGLLDLAGELAEQEGAATIQEYCERLLARTLGDERSRRDINEVEAKRGPLEGFQAIAQDPTYLAEWSDRKPEPEPAAPGRTRPLFLDDPSIVILPDEPRQGEPHGRPAVRLRPSLDGEPVVREPTDAERVDHQPPELPPERPNPGDEGPDAFLPRLRRGESAPPETVRALLAELRRIEVEHRGRGGLDRKLAHALHRLSLEAQVMLTEAWPGVFDEPTVGAIRAVQEGVERVLSGEDVRFYPQGGPEAGA